MKKVIGINTLHGYFNYGNRLQNYALKFVIENLNFDVITTVVNNKEMYSPKKRLLRALQRNPLENVSIIKNKINKKDEQKIVKDTQTERENHFKNFSRDYLNEKFYELTNNEDVNKLSDFSYFVTGSDQVWNPANNNESGQFFLTFVPSEKRIAYSASFGINEIPNKYVPSYKKWLKEMNYISVREEAGAKIVKDLTNREAPVLVDPTMLLTKDEWLSIANRANNRPDSPYLLTYFLGGPSDETREKLNKLALENNMTIINLGDITEKETYETGPSEFLDYINNAEAFFTDSFHGVVFSIIFNTPFIVFERISSGASMYSRIETILDKFGMNDREVEAFSTDIFSMDFSNTNQILKLEHQKSIEYLKETLDVEK